MRFASFWAGIFLGSVTLLGCSASEMLEKDTASGTPPDDDNPIDATLIFEGPTAIELTPGETRPVTVVASPAREFELYFALLDAPSDASLDASHVFTDADGRATVSIHAPGTPASFTLRAWIKDGPSTEVSVAVSKQGIGSIEVVPDYNGHRPITEWTGAVVVGTTCDAIADKLPGEPKGSLVAVSPAQQNPLVQSVPVGPKLAVHVRAGHFAWGCTDATDITAGTSTKVKVHVADVAPALDQTDLDLTASYAPDPAVYAKIVDAAADVFLATMFPPDKPTPEALLQGMIDNAYDPDGLAIASAEGDWETIADAHFAELSSPLPSRMKEWIDLGLAAGTPQITGRLVAIEGVPGKALFHTGTIGGFDAASVGAPPVHLFSWTSGPDDAVFLSGDLYWLPSRFIGAACRQGSEQDLGYLPTITDVLGKAAGCSDLAASLGGTDTCDVTCLKDLCRTALTAQWQAAIDASADAAAVGAIHLGASGTVKVDDVAAPLSMNGMWLGTVSDGDLTASVSGPLAGIVAEDPVPDEPPTP